MNYTENYHLPQWVKEDRIMMEDFNAAMSSIENGLTGNKDSGDETRTKTWSRLCRLAYNHYCAVQAMEPFPNQMGVFFQNVVKNYSGVTGTMEWDGARFAGKSSVTLNAVMVEEAYQQLTPLKISPYNPALSQPLTAIFTPPASGRINLYFLHGNYDNNTPGEKLRCRLTMTDMDTGVQERPIELVFDNTFTNAGFNYHIDSPFFVRGGVRYRVVLEPLNHPCTMEATFQPGGQSVSSYANEGKVSAAMDLHEPEGGQGGMAVLHCAIGGQGGKLTLKWDERELEPQISRIVKGSDGRTMQELIFLREDAIPADSRLSLDFTCEMDGNFLFYDWGAMLF